MITYKKILIMWTEPTTYLVGCLQELLKRAGTSLMLVFKNSCSTNLNHISELQGAHIIDLSNYTSSSTTDLLTILFNFSPDIALISMSKTGFFARAAKSLRKQSCAVIAACDNYWKNSPRDYINAVLSKLGIFNKYDAVMVPGNLGRIYVEKIGFKKEHIIEGLYTCKTDIFRAVGIDRHKNLSQRNWPCKFLYIGRLITIKGIRQLLSAYEYYRRCTPNPWPLVVIGDGPLKANILNISGIDFLGPKTSEECAKIMQMAGAFILPSLKDHWGVVVHEATCAGLPIIASLESGATVELVRDGYNGFKYPAQNWKMLAKYMQLFSDSIDLRKFGRASLRLSYQFDPVLWSEKICSVIPSLLKKN